MVRPKTKRELFAGGGLRLAGRRWVFWSRFCSGPCFPGLLCSLELLRDFGFCFRFSATDFGGGRSGGMDILEKTQVLAEEALALYRGHFKQLFVTAAVVLLPIALLGFAVDVYLAGGVVRTREPGGALFVLASMLTVIAFQLFILLPVSILGGIFAQAAQTCQLRAIAAGLPIPDAKQAWKGLVPKLFPLLLTSGLVSVLAGIGMFCLVIPGLWVLYRGMMVAQVVVHEETTGLAAFARSGQLVKKVGGEFWVALVVFAVAGAVGSSLLGAVLPGVLSGFATALLRVVLMPLPLIVVWLTYRKVRASEVDTPSIVPSKSGPIVQDRSLI